MNLFKKKPKETENIKTRNRKTDTMILYKYFCMFQTVDGKTHRYDIDEWCYKDVNNLPRWCIDNGYIRDNFDNIYPMTSILSFNWNYWDKLEIEYYIDEVDFYIPSFPSEEYIERIRVKG